MNKCMYGQYFTIANPFFVSVFYDWFSKIPENDRQCILEPFAGRNNIINLVNELFIRDADKIKKWKCYDIDASLLTLSNAKGYTIEVRDTIKNYPSGEANVVITNPPYLAKNSATRKGYNTNSFSGYTDIYQVCLEVMLKNTGWVAAIIPETYIKTNLFLNRLYAISSLTCRMFDDTDCPVCLALFIPEAEKSKCHDLNDEDFYIYRMNEYIGKMSDIKDKVQEYKDLVGWKFNDKSGNVGLYCIDNTKRESIRFVPGKYINEEKIKISSRSITRISGLPDNIALPPFIDKCNFYLAEYRDNTKDVLMASFKGLREDGNYRRRLDFKTARNILNQAYYDMAV